MDTTDLIKEMKILQEKGIKYENMRDKYQEFANRLNDAKEILDGVIKELNPFINVNARESSGIDYDELAAEVYEKIQAGLCVDVPLLARTYEKLGPVENNRAAYLFNKIRNMPGIDERKEGKKVIIYAKKEWKQ